MATKIKKLLILISLVFGLFAVHYPQSKSEKDSWNAPVEPFRIVGNIYYVGASDITSYLITTPKGHILIDGGLTETVPQIKKNVVKLGFKLEDIKIILNSHAHYDHAGGIAELRRLTHAKFLASEKDAPLLEHGGFDDPNFGDKYPFESVKPDETFQDGKKVKLGRSILTANITAGHTKGCTTWTTTAKENGKKLNVIFVCSVSSPGYQLVDNKKYPDMEADYLGSFAWFRNEKVDVFLASHASFYDMEEKAEKLRRGSAANPFIDPHGYKEFIKEAEKSFTEKLIAQKAAKK